MTNPIEPFSDYPKPAVAIDLALVTVTKAVLKVLVMQRDDATSVGGNWALPGGFVHIDESLEDTVSRVLSEKANTANAYLEQLGTFGALHRDPRGRVISVAYFALTPADQLETALSGKKELQLAEIDVPWDGETGGSVDVIDDAGRSLDLAFDHADILGQVVKRLRGKLDYTAVGFELLAEKFTLREAQEIHEAILGRPLTKPAFRRKLLDRGLIRPTGEREAPSAFRPAELYERIRSERS